MRPKPKQLVPQGRRPQFLLTFIVSLAMVLLALAVRLWPRTVPYAQCSDLYKRYAAVDDIDATFIKGYQVNDTLAVDVTLLEAKDSAGWDMLKRDFEIQDPPPVIQQLIDKGNDLIGTKKIPRQQDLSQQDTSGITYDVAAISHLMHTISIFHTKDLSERRAAMDHNFEYNEQQTSK